MLTLLLPVLLAAPQQPQTVTELLPLQQLCERDHRAATPPWHSLLRYVPHHDRRANLVLDGNGSSGISAQGIYNVLENLEGEAISEERLFLNTVGESLLAFGETTSVDRVRKLVHEATQVLARPLQVEFSVWDAAGRETPAGVLSPDDFARFRGERKPIWRSVSIGSPAAPITLEHMAWRRYVRTLQVEVANKQTMSHPATDRYAEGCQAAVRAYPLLGSDDFAVFLQFAAAQPRGILRSVQTGMSGAADVDLPRLETYFGACSGRIPNGGALAMTMRGNASGGGQLVLTLHVAASAPPSELSDPSMALIPCGAITSSALQVRAALPSVMQSVDDHFHHDDEAVFGNMPADTLLELTNSVLESHEQTDEFFARLGGGYLFVKASAEVVTKVRALVRGLQDKLIRNVELQHRADLQPQTGEGEQNLPALHELTMPSLIGRELVAVRLHESNIFANVFCEIASEAATLAPGIELLQSGAWLRGRAIPLATGMHLELDLQVSNAPIPSMRSVMPGGGVLMPTRRATSRLSHDGVIQAGQAISHGDGPDVLIEGRNYGSTMSTTLRR